MSGFVYNVYDGRGLLCFVSLDWDKTYAFLKSLAYDMTGRPRLEIFRLKDYK